MTLRSRALRASPLSLCIAVGLTALGCAHVDAGPAFQDVSEMVRGRQSVDLTWSQEANPTQIPPATVLDRDAAVQLVLRHNAQLQATFEDLGIAAADLVQASRLQNPSLHVSARSPEGGISGTNIELGLAQNLLQLFTLRSQKRIATTEFEETKLRIAQTVLDTAQDAELAYLDLVAANQQLELRRTILEASEAGFELARRFHEAGNISELQLRREQSLTEDARVAILQVERRRSRARKELRNLLGTWGESEANWTTGARLPDVPANDPDLAELEKQAVDERFDLKAGLQEVRALELALGLNRRWRLLGGLEIEASAEQELDGEWVIGPGFDLELPLFNQGQPRVARAAAALRRAERSLEARIAMVRSEVLQLREQLNLERTMARRYITEIIPLNERTVVLAQEQYNYMLAGIFEVLQSKQNEYDAYETYIDTVRDYWQTRTRLRFAVGGRLPEPDFQVPPPDDVDPDTEHHHHNPGTRP